MTVTTRGCPATDYLKEGVAKSALLVPGLESVDVIVTFDPPRRPGMISPGVKTLLGFAEVNRANIRSARGNAPSERLLYRSYAAGEPGEAKEPLPRNVGKFAPRQTRGERLAR